MTNIMHNEPWSVNRAYRQICDAWFSKHVRCTIKTLQLQCTMQMLLGRVYVQYRKDF